MTKPDNYVRSIRPEEGTHFACDFHRIVNTQPLQRLNVKCAIVKIAVNTFFPVNTLPLTKQLPRHIGSPRFLPHHAEILKPLIRNVGAFYKSVRLRRGSDTISRTVRSFENFVDVCEISSAVLSATPLAALLTTLHATRTTLLPLFDQHRVSDSL